MTRSTRSPQKFNATQTDYKVTPVFKGQYDESMAAAIAAYRAGNPPQIVQIFEVGTATMMAAKGAIKPVYQLMAESGEKFDPKAFVGAVYGYYSDTQGRLLSMPFNSSTQVLYINDDAFKKAGLDPNNPPKTWPEVGAAAEKLKASGAACAFTTGWQSWVQLESFSRLAQRADRDAGKRFRRPRHAARVERSASGQAHPDARRLVEEGPVHLRRPQGRTAGANSRAATAR